MNIVPSFVTRSLERFGMEIKNIRADNVITIQKDSKIIAAYHLVSQRFWVKDPSYEKNGNMRSVKKITDQQDLDQCLRNIVNPVTPVSPIPQSQYSFEGEMVAQI